MKYTDKKVSGTKAEIRGGKQGGGSVASVQLGRTSPHGRDLKAPHPDRALGGKGQMGQGSKYMGSMEKSYKNP